MQGDIVSMIDQQLFDDLPCGLISFSPKGKIISINDTMCRWAGRDRTELLNQDFRSMLDRPSALYYSMVIDPLLNLKGFASEFSLKFVSSESHFDALLNVQVVKSDNGMVMTLTAAVFKVAVRKKYENELLLEKRNAEELHQLAEEEKRKLDFLFNSMPNQVWTTNPQGIIINRNESTNDYFGKMQGISNSWFPNVAREDRSIALAHWRKSIITGRKFERELRLCCVKNDPEWFLIRAQPYYNPAGDIEIWFCSAVNIHQRKLLQLANQMELTKNLVSAYQSLDEKSELLVEIAYTQSHMVRRPLANLLGLAGLMKEERNSETLAILLKKLIQSASELDDMVRTISKKTVD